MEKTVLFSHTKNNINTLKKELKIIYDICEDVSVVHIDEYDDSYTNNENYILFVFKVYENTDHNIIQNIIRIASKNDSDVLFILAGSCKGFFDKIENFESIWYIKEPYTEKELQYIISKIEKKQFDIHEDFRMVTESVHDIIFSMKPSGEIFYVSPSVEKITGFTQEETFKKELKELITERSFKFIAGLMETFSSKLRKGESPRIPVFETEILCKDGSTLWMELTIQTVFDENHNFRHFTGTMHDITDRKNAEERFKKVAGCSNDLIYEWDMRSDKLEWFGNIGKALGYEEKEMKGTLNAWSQKVHPDDLPEVIEKIEEYRKNADFFKSEYRVIAKNGEIRYWQEYGTPIFDDHSGEFIKTIGVCSDITDKKKAENALKESEEMFRLIAENANDVIWLLDSKGDFLYVSPSVKKLRGYTPDELMELPIEERLTTESSQKVMEIWTTFFKKFKKGVLPDTPRIIEVEQPCKDGSTVWTELHINPVMDEHGNFKFFLGISRDISDRKKSEHILRKQNDMLDTIFELAPIPMVLVNKNGFVENLNKECTEITGLEKENSVGLKAGEVFSCEKASKNNECGTCEECCKCIFHNARMETFRTKKNIHKREGSTTIQLPDGTHIQKSVQVSTAYIDIENDAKMIFSVEDITERKKAEETIIRSMIEAEEANRTKSEFLATMSHELRTPLNAIIGFSQMLQENDFGHLNNEQKRFANHISSSGKHLLELINDILDLSKIEAGKMDLHFEDFYLNTIMNNVYNVISPLAKKKRIEVNFLIPDDINIYADKIKFKQILYNLISNAVKFTHNKGHVYVIAAAEDEMLKVSVIDDGIGINKEEKEKLFNPFYQADSSNSRSFQGTGLGLSIVKKIIELHGGTIEVESEYGKGSTFTFSMPRKNRSYPYSDETVN